MQFFLDLQLEVVVHPICGAIIIVEEFERFFVRKLNVLQHFDCPQVHVESVIFQ